MTLNMAKGKLYENARYKHSAPGLTVILPFIDEAKNEFYKTSDNTKSLTEHYENIQVWFKQQFGDEK